MIDETIARLEALRDAAVVGDENAARIEKELADCRGLLAEVLAASESLKIPAAVICCAPRAGEKLDALKKQRAALDEQARGFLQNAAAHRYEGKTAWRAFRAVSNMLSHRRAGALSGGAALSQAD